MNDNRSEILAQLASGQITADQAAEQLRGSSTPSEPPLSLPPAPAQTSRWLRVRVTDLATGRQRVNVNMPLSWLSFGLRIGARFSPEVAGLDANELLAALQSGTNGPVVDVEDLDDGQRVQIFIE